jgi:hypothetical protein
VCSVRELIYIRSTKSQLINAVINIRPLGEYSRVVG